MGRIISYIIYFIIAVALYILIKAAFIGDINSSTTIGNAATEVKTGTINTLKNISHDASSVIKQNP